MLLSMRKYSTLQIHQFQTGNARALKHATQYAKIFDPSNQFQTGSARGLKHDTQYAKIFDPSNISIFVAIL
jgi:hypothetical protein